ncbi:tetratricopeptide repeat protein [Streptomyces sp. NPDC058155]|uniref:tetratricopeptide repeat protein n=1 Tax=Streptomyces sp. NPDC058155 TaxID=3346359 RepID=UPI0036E464F7
MTSRAGYCGERPELWLATVRRSFGRALEQVEAGREVSDTQLKDAATVLDNVMRYGVEVDSLLLAHFLTRLTQVSVSAGEHGDRFDGHDLITAIDRSMPLVEAAGLATWPLHVARASYYSRQDDGRNARREALDAARLVCAGDRDTVEVGLMLAQLHIDLCEYRAARRLLAECRRLCDDPVCADRLPELHICYGNLYYVQGSLKAALHHFQSALATAGDPVPTTAYRAAVRAHHYSGKILSALGRHQEALDQLIRIEGYACVSEAERNRRAGFLHLRLGEVLTAGGSLDEAHHHLCESRKIFVQLRESGTAQAILDSAVATLLMRQGWRRDALAVLAGAVRAARRDNYRRGVVLFETKAALYHFHGRDWGGLLRSGSAALGAWIRLNGAGNLVRAVVGSVEYVVSSLWQRLRRGPRTPALAGPVRCPCGNCLRESEP